MIQRRRLLTMGAGAAALAASGAVAGCSGFTNQTNEPQAQPEGAGGESSAPTPQELMCWANPDQKALFEKTLAKFTEQTGIEVTVTTAGSAEYFKKINSMTMSNSLPDLFWANNQSGIVAPMAANGKLYDWTATLDNPPEDAPLDKSKFGPGYLELFSVDGKVVGIPQEVNTNGIYYNKRILSDAGVDFPTADWSWDDLFAATESLVGKGGKQKFGMQIGLTPFDDPFGASMYSMSNGGPGLAGEQSTTFRGVTAVEASPQFREGAQHFVDLVKAGAINGPDFSTQNTIATFMNGEIPLMYGGQWFTAFFSKELADDWGFMTMPKGSNGSVAILEGNAFCSPANLKDPASTWKLIQYMLTTGFNDAYSEIGITPLAYTPGSQGFFDFMAKKAEKEKGYSEVTDAVRADLANPNKCGTSYLDKWANRANDVTKAVWNPMLNGKKPVPAAVDDYVSQLQGLIKA